MLFLTFGMWGFLRGSVRLLQGWGEGALLLQKRSLGVVVWKQMQFFSKGFVGLVITELNPKPSYSSSIGFGV